MSETEPGGPEGAAEVPAEEPAAAAAEPAQPAAEAPEPGSAAPSDGTEATGAGAPDGPAAALTGDSRPSAQDTARSAPRRETGDGGDFTRYQQARQQNALNKLKRSAVANGSGSAFYAEQLTLGGDSGVEIQVLSVSSLTVAQQLDSHQDVDQQSQMAARLAAQHILVLAGQPGSGRQSTALTLLAGCCPDDRIKILHSEAQGILQTLCQRADDLLTPGGFVVDLDDQPLKLSTLETLGHLARKHRAFLVIIGELGRVDPDRLRPHAFEHRRPAVGKVLAVHLRRLLAGHPGACPHQDCTTEHTTAFTARMLDSQQVQRTLDGAPSVRSVVEFAEVLAQSIHAEDTSLGDVIGQWRDRLRRLAKQLLQVPAETSHGPVLDPHRQAFRIAYAFFHGHPLSDVFEAGEVLSATVLPRYETREPAPTNHVFERELDQLIPQEMRASGDAMSGGRTDDNPRCARLVDEELMHAVIEVVWHDYDSLRDPLREWLTALVAGPLERIRVRAAHIAGILLSHDFDSVYRDLIRHWARKSAAYRQSAALALEMAAHDPRMVGRVRAQIRSWLSSPRWEFQDSAARAYGTLVGAQDVPDTLWALRELGTRPELAFSSSVAFSMSWLYLAGAPGPTADALDRWITSDNDHLTKHAIRTLLILSRYGAGPDRRDRPVLADTAMTDQDRADALVRLWRHALMGQDSSTRAWDLLRRWLLAGDADKELAAFLEVLVPRICARPLSLRAGFYLAMWAGRHPDSRTIRQLRDQPPKEGAASGSAS
ncbi:hypothetical protein [Streptomyces nigrescens]|uniref:AAA+ ATPase domain-containing protein n=1 Tax=Streptomyces nigrescens TaxID=1920 RepID=A0ABY7JCQ7_STRNI|nr:hypothetical protein [Streptomyces nigrescens]WAU09122.1 hypothetical protein STRNI_007893 [Streptomyces nigrescens]